MNDTELRKRIAILWMHGLNFGRISYILGIPRLEVKQAVKEAGMLDNRNAEMKWVFTGYKDIHHTKEFCCPICNHYTLDAGEFCAACGQKMKSEYVEE